MTRRRTVTVRAEETTTPTNGKIVVVLEGQERELNFSDYNVTFDSTDSEILEAISPRILEETGINLQESEDESYYTVKKMENTGNVMIFPKSTMG